MFGVVHVVSAVLVFVFLVMVPKNFTLSTWSTPLFSFSKFTIKLQILWPIWSSETRSSISMKSSLLNSTIHFVLKDSNLWRVFKWHHFFFKMLIESHQLQHPLTWMVHLLVGKVVNFIFSYLQCKTLLKIWWGQYYSRIKIKKIFLTSVTPLYIPSESRTRPFPPKTHTIWRNTNYFCNISAFNISFRMFFWLLSPKMMLKRQSGEPFFYKIENHP